MGPQRRRATVVAASVAIVACAAGAWLRLSRPAIAPASQPAPTASERAVASSEFLPLPECGCGPWKLSWRPSRQGEDSKMEPGRRLYVVPEFRLEHGDRNWVIQPGGDAALPQRVYVPRVRLGIACDDNGLVVAGAHWASAYGLGFQRWTRRIDADPSLPNHVVRVADSTPGVESIRIAKEQPALGSTDVSFSCAPLEVDRGHARIADVGGNAGWYELRLGMKKD